MHSRRTRSVLVLAVVSLSLAGCGGGLTNGTLPAGVTSDTFASGSSKTAHMLAELRNPAQTSNSVLVGLKAGVSQSELKRLETQHGARLVQVLDAVNSAVMQPANSGTSALALAAELTKDPAVEYADREAIGSISIATGDGGEAPSATGDPMRTRQWALDKMEAEKSWAVNRGSPQTVIAIVDTGVDLTHPDLREKLVQGVNIAEPDKSPMDDYGHGTHVSGTAAAVADNGLGIAGLATRARIMPVKVNAPKSGYVPEAQVAAGVTWAVNHGADVINMSLGYPPDMPLKTLKRALYYALSHKVVIVAAMGNEFETNGPDSKSQPASLNQENSFRNIIAVGATTPDDKRASFSNTGSWITVSAPGYSILATTPTYQVEMTGMKDDGIDFQMNYGTCSGTSMATPYVSALAAIMLAASHNHEPALIKSKLQVTADDIGAAGFDNEFGWGRINAFRAVKTSS